MKTESAALVMIKWAMSMARSEGDLRAWTEVECNKKALSALADDDKDEARNAYAKAREILRGKR